MTTKPTLFPESGNYWTTREIGLHAGRIHLVFVRYEAFKPVEETEPLLVQEVVRFLRRKGPPGTRDPNFCLDCGGAISIRNGYLFCPACDDADERGPVALR